MSIEYFGDKLRAMRKNKGWTQMQLAKRLKLVTGTISAYETGTKYPSLEVLVKICDLFDVSADFLLGISDNNTVIKMGGLTENQMQPFLQIISEVAQYNVLREQNESPKKPRSLLREKDFK